MSLRINDFFDVREFIPKKIYESQYNSARIFINQNIVNGITEIRKLIGKPVILNTWHTGGSFQYRGYRDPNCTVGAKFSQHRFANAIDFHVVGISSEELRQWIIKNWTTIGKYFTTMEEDTDGWVHLDNRFVSGVALDKPFMVPFK